MSKPVETTFSLPQRPRRLRHSALVRDMVREHHLHASQLVLPLFVSAQVKGREPVVSMPGVYQTDVAELCRDVEKALGAGVRRVMLFGVPSKKDPLGKEAYSPASVVQKSLSALRKNFGAEVLLMADTCLCQYTSHGHCGVLSKNGAVVDNDATLGLLGKIAVAQARAGADFVAPSGMIDGMVGVMRTALDTEGLTDTGILSYAVKYASALYGPFRDAAESTPSHGDRRAQQMDPANAREALREAALDETQGADMLMVKPALSYLDVIHRLRQQSNLPIAAYFVSGEYSMIKAAALKGWLDEPRVVHETHLAVVRAGADILLTYYAVELAGWMKKGFFA